MRDKVTDPLYSIVPYCQSVVYYAIRNIVSQIVLVVLIRLVIEPFLIV